MSSSVSTPNDGVRNYDDGATSRGVDAEATTYGGFDQYGSHRTANVLDVIDQDAVEEVEKYVEAPYSGSYAAAPLSPAVDQAAMQEAREEVDENADVILPANLRRAAPASRKLMQASFDALGVSKKGKGKKKKSAAPELVVEKSSKVNYNEDTPEFRAEAAAVDALKDRILSEWGNLADRADFDAAIRSRYGISDQYLFERVQPGALSFVAARGEGKDGIYLPFDNFMAGMRPPFDPFFVEIFNFFGALPRDFTPNTVRAIAGFIATCRLNRVEPTLSLLKVFFDFGKAGGSEGQLLTRHHEASPRLLFPPCNKVAEWMNRLMHVESLNGWPFPHHAARGKDSKSTWGKKLPPCGSWELKVLRNLIGAVGNVPKRLISTRQLTDLNFHFSHLAGIPGSDARYRSQRPVIDVQRMVPEMCENDWYAECHIGVCFPSACGCKGNLV